MEPDDDDDASEYTMYKVTSTKTKPIIAMVKMNGREMQMEVDTGASMSIISDSTYRTLQTAPHTAALQKSEVKLTTYTGENVPVLGSVDVTVTYGTQVKELSVLVVQGNGPSLLGRDWLREIRLDWQQLHQMNQEPAMWQEVVERHSDLFKDELGLVKGVTAKIQLDPQAQPKFLRSRPVPYALRDKVEEELDRLEKAGIIEKVSSSDWATPIVPVMKQDGSVRICGDYKQTLNQVTKKESYPIPRIEDIYASLSGGQSFTKLDLAHAYNQIPLDEESKDLTVITTHKGLYRYNRLPFGISSAPAVFQRTMETLLQGIPNVSVYIDDLLITGKTDEEHLRTLEKVLVRLEKAGIRLKQGKCAFMLKSVEYLGHRISAQGLQATEKKVQAVKSAPAPTDLQQLKSFLGLINYYSKFLPNLSGNLSPLYRLLQKKARWEWGPEQQKAFETTKSQLSSDRVLVHYDPDKPIILACDASPYGLGAVLSHKLENGEEKPIAYTSRSLAPAEKKYSQIEKEALAIVFGVVRFHQYLYGRPFTILSDHKPLQGVFKETAGVPVMASARIQRWGLTLSAYDYKIKFKAGSENANADLLSRLPLPETPTRVPEPGETVLLMEVLDSTLVTATRIKSWTEKDPILSQVKDMILHGWQLTTTAELSPFHTRQHELSVHDGCILWGSRVVVPPAGRAAMIDELHESHPGICRMKALARSYVWWPGMDKELETKVKTCDVCQQARPADRPVAIHPWEWPKRPWARLHLDYAGPLFGKMYLILIDAYSKWLEVKIVSSATSSATIEHLRSIFSVHGLPELIVSDNGSVFTSAEFQDFMVGNGIRHIRTAPYHPASNGQAERAVKIVKDALKKSTKDSLQTQLSRFLFRYRLTPHSTTGVAPAELLFGRRPRSHLDLVKPTLQGKVQSKQVMQAAQRGGRQEKDFRPGSLVFAKNFGTGRPWLEGSIVRASGPKSVRIELSDGRTIRRHVNHVRPRATTLSSEPQEASPDWAGMTHDDTDVPEPVAEPTIRRSTRLQERSHLRYPPV